MTLGTAIVLTTVSLGARCAASTASSTGRSARPRR
jgi:hypothetical protein